MHARCIYIINHAPKPIVCGTLTLPLWLTERVSVVMVMKSNMINISHLLSCHSCVIYFAICDFTSLHLLVCSRSSSFSLSFFRSSKHTYYMYASAVNAHGGATDICCFMRSSDFFFHQCAVILFRFVFTSPTSEVSAERSRSIITIIIMTTNN